MNDHLSFLTPGDLTSILGGLSVQAVYKILKSNNADTITLSSRSKVISPASVRSILIDRGFTYPKLNISYQMVKGGVGKTTIAHLSAIRAAHYGARVLVVDVDQQANLTTAMDVEARAKPVLIDILKGNVPLKEAIIPMFEGLDLLPSNLNNSILEAYLTVDAHDFKSIFVDMLSTVRDSYDVVIFDCPPALNKTNTAVSCASDLIILPINPEPYAMDGLVMSIDELSKISNKFKANCQYKILWNKYDARERLAPTYMHAIAKEESMIANVLPVVIRTDASAKNAVADKSSVFQRGARSNIKDDADQLTRELLGLNDWVPSMSNASHKKAGLELETV